MRESRSVGRVEGIVVGITRRRERLGRSILLSAVLIGPPLLPVAVVAAPVGGGAGRVLVDPADEAGASTAATAALADPVIAVSAGHSHSCALLTSGAIRCWGSNDFGQLGDGTTTMRLIPVAVRGIATAVAISAGHTHTCALLADRTVRCWGENLHGELGDGTRTRRTTPVAVLGLANVTAIAASDSIVGSAHTCALLLDRTVRCWGANRDGQLGDGTRTERLVPVTVRGVSGATAIAAGVRDGCAIVAGGTVTCWDTTTRTISGVAGATAIASGERHGCALIDSGALRCWGQNLSGELGTGTTFGWTDGSVAVVGIGSATAVTVDGSHTCARLADGSPRCWGDNWRGALGNGTSTASSLPGAVTGLPSIEAIDAGASHTCAVSGGAVHCWGGGDLGALGTGSTASVLVPAPVAVGGTGATVGEPVTSLRLGAQISSSLPAAVTWVGNANDGPPIARYELASSTDGGTTWRTVRTDASTGIRVALAPAGTIRHRVRPIATDGTPGEWTAGRRLVPRLVQQSASAVRFAGTWTTVYASGYSGGSARSSSTAGASLTYSVAATSVALVASVGPTRGKVRVYVDGVATATVDLYAATSRARVVVWQRSWGLGTLRTVRFVVLGTSGRPRVDIDALVVDRQQDQGVGEFIWFIQCSGSTARPGQLFLNLSEGQVDDGGIVRLAWRNLATSDLYQVAVIRSGGFIYARGWSGPYPKGTYILHATYEARVWWDDQPRMVLVQEDCDIRNYL